MKRTITVKKEVEIKKVKISVEPRYVGDGEDDDMPTDFPLLQNGLWTAIVDVDTGAIENWPTGDIRSLHIKVCDAGSSQARFVEVRVEMAGRFRAQKSLLAKNGIRQLHVLAFFNICQPNALPQF